MALTRTAKSCGPDASTLAIKFAFHHAGDGGKQARSPGRARRKPLKPLRAGMPGVAVYSFTRVHFYQCKAHTRLRLQRAPGVPHALSWARAFMQRLGRFASRGRSGIWNWCDVIATREAT